MCASLITVDSIIRRYNEKCLNSKLVECDAHARIVWICRFLFIANDIRFDRWPWAQSQCCWFYWKSLKFWQFVFILLPLPPSSEGTVALSLIIDFNVQTFNEQMKTNRRGKKNQILELNLFGMKKMLLTLFDRDYVRWQPHQLLKRCFHMWTKW